MTQKNTTSEREIAAMETLNTLVILFYLSIFRQPEPSFNVALKTFKMHVCCISKFSMFNKLLPRTR